MTETKIAPTEAKSRGQRERGPDQQELTTPSTRVKAKGIGKVVNIKVANLQRSRRRLQPKALRSSAGVAGTVRQRSDEGRAVATHKDRTGSVTPH